MFRRSSDDSGGVDPGVRRDDRYPPSSHPGARLAHAGIHRTNAASCPPTSNPLAITYVPQITLWLPHAMGMLK